MFHTSFLFWVLCSSLKSNSLLMTGVLWAKLSKKMYSVSTTITFCPSAWPGYYKILNVVWYNSMLKLPHIEYFCWRRVLFCFQPKTGIHFPFLTMPIKSTNSCSFFIEHLFWDMCSYEGAYNLVGERDYYQIFQYIAVNAKIKAQARISHRETETKVKIISGMWARNCAGFADNPCKDKSDLKELRAHGRVRACARRAMM